MRPVRCTYVIWIVSILFVIAISTVDAQAGVSDLTEKTFVGACAYSTYSPYLSGIFLTAMTRGRERPISLKDSFVASQYAEGINDISVSPDGRCVLAALNLRVETRSNQSDLWLFDTRRGSKSAVTSDFAGYNSIQWSPDSLFFACISNEGSSMGCGDTSWPIPTTLYVQSLRTGKRLLLLRDVMSNYSWLPDRDLLFATSQTKPGLFIFDVEGRRHTVRLRNVSDSGVFVSHDGSTACFVKPGHITVYRIPGLQKDLGDASRWHLLWECDVTNVDKCAISSDGSYVVVTTVDMGRRPGFPRHMGARFAQ